MEPPAVMVDATTLTNSLPAFPLFTASGYSHGEVITELWHKVFSSDVPEGERRQSSIHLLFAA